MGKEHAHMVTPVFSTQQPNLSCAKAYNVERIRGFTHKWPVLRKTVSRVQGSVFRFIVERFQFLKLLSVILKQFVFLIFFFLNAEIWIRDAAHAHDFGIRGKIAPITEEDPILLIQSKLKTMEERGELKLHNIELQKKTRAAIERPKPAECITNAQKDRIFYYDPTYIVQEDLKDHQGRIFYKKGTRINPLETVSLSQSLLFFDGDDADQVAFAKEKLSQGSIKLILTNGTPLALSETWKVPVYFDQSGRLTQQLGIHHVPALVTQNRLPHQDKDRLSANKLEANLRLRIEEIALNTEKNNPSKIKKEP